MIYINAVLINMKFIQDAVFCILNSRNTSNHIIRIVLFNSSHTSFPTLKLISLLFMNLLDTLILELMILKLV